MPYFLSRVRLFDLFFLFAEFLMFLEFILPGESLSFFVHEGGAMNTRKESWGQVFSVH